MDTRLCLLPSLQGWDGGVMLSLRLLAAPRGRPLDPLVPDGAGGASFATANLVFDIRLVPGLDELPTTSSNSVSVTIAEPAPPLASALMQELESELQINLSPPPPNPRPAGTEIRKYAPLTYRTAAGFSGGRTPKVIADDSYHCALRSLPTGFKKLPELSALGLPWGRILALALRQPALAEALGLIRPLAITLPSGDFFQNGGWVYVTLGPGSDAFELVGQPGALKLYATRVPPVRKPRRLFTAVLFPVASTVPPGPYDELFQEAADYDDGFAKIVHGRQPSRVDALSDDDAGSRPLKDLGIRLAWDDEQVAIWLNRQIDISAASLDAPMGVHGYRLDVRAGTAGDWSSLCQAQGPVTVGSINVGAFQGELDVQTHPTQPEGQTTGTYWLPMYYTQWSGGSLLGVDQMALQLAGVQPNGNGGVIGVPPPVLLRYGQSYQFRVRLADHTFGGPTVDDEPGSDSAQPITTVPFRRYVRPGAPRVSAQTPAAPSPSDPLTQMSVLRPRLAYPAYVYTGAPNAVADLLADLPAAQAEDREPGLPDPDVTTILVSVQVQALGLDGLPGGGTAEGYLPVYETTQSFPSDPAAPAVLNFQWVDVAQVANLKPLLDGAIVLPTARNVRLVLTSMAREDPGNDYFGASDVRFGGSIAINVRASSSDERELLAPETPAHLLHAIFLQPESPLDAATQFAQRAAGRPFEAPTHAVGRLASDLGLAVNGLTVHARPGRRMVFGASAGLRHVLAPDHSGITFASSADLTSHWIIALRATLNRDWTWDGLAPAGISVVRDGVGEVGRIEPRRSINPDALAHPERDSTDLVFLDVVDPKPVPGAFPSEITLSYRLDAQFVSPPAQTDPPFAVSVTLPMTTAPSQVPKIVSAGLALSPYVRSSDYSSTEPRRRVLWIEFDAPVENTRDAYFARMLAYAPDPVLLGTPVDPPDQAEPPLPIDPEPIRTIIPGQSDDRAGLDAMQPMTPSDSSRHFMLALPSGLSEDAPELFGFFTYEFRVGHSQGWSTAQGRFGAPLRVTGVQHPCPSLTCSAVRASTGLEASAPFALPVVNGRSVRPVPPVTQLFVFLYARVVKADSSDNRNVLLSQKPAGLSQNPPFPPSLPEALYGTAAWTNDEIAQLLASLTLGPDTPLSCLAAETMPAGGTLADPLGASLGEQRILRTSTLVTVPASCS